MLVIFSQQILTTSIHYKKNSMSTCLHGCDHTTVKAAYCKTKHTLESSLAGRIPVLDCGNESRFIKREWCFSHSRVLLHKHRFVNDFTGRHTQYVLITSGCVWPRKRPDRMYLSCKKAPRTSTCCLRPIEAKAGQRLQAVTRSMFSSGQNTLWKVHWPAEFRCLTVATNKHRHRFYYGPPGSLP